VIIVSVKAWCDIVQIAA